VSYRKPTARNEPRVRLVLTRRDVAVLADLARFGVLSQEQIRRRHFPDTAPGASTVRGRLRLLQLAGYVRHLPGGPFQAGVYLATARGIAQTGLGLRPVAPADGAQPVWVWHHLTVADLADALLFYARERGTPGVRWLTERELRAGQPWLPREPARRARARVRGGGYSAPDGCLLLPAPDGQGAIGGGGGAGVRLAVEAELHHKADRFYEAKLAWYREHLTAPAPGVPAPFDRARYYCATPAIAAAIERVAGRLGVVPLDTRPLPPGVAVYRARGRAA
jgi:hypothetical protein